MNFHKTEVAGSQESKN